MRCVYCRKEYPHNLSLKEIFGLSPLWSKRLCTNCKNSFTLLEKDAVCHGCSRIVENNMVLCDECQIWKEKYPHYAFHHTSFYSYDEDMHDWFQRYKFIGDYHLAHSFAEDFYDALHKRKEIVVPIPLSEERLQSRGFNQVSSILDVAHIKYENVLEKNRADAVPQSKKTKKERMCTPQPFNLSENWRTKVQDKSFLLVDDIYTTGRTLFHAADCLLQGGAKSVETYSLAR